MITFILFSGLPVKQGILFSEDEHKADVDRQKIKGLIAPAKVTLFEVENDFWFTLISHLVCIQLS